MVWIYKILVVGQKWSYVLIIHLHSTMQCILKCILHSTRCTIQAWENILHVCIATCCKDIVTYICNKVLLIFIFQDWCSYIYIIIFHLLFLEIKYHNNCFHALKKNLNMTQRLEDAVARAGYYYSEAIKKDTTWIVNSGGVTCRILPGFGTQ